MLTKKSSIKKEQDNIEAVVPLLPTKYISNDETRTHYITFEVTQEKNGQFYRLGGNFFVQI